MDIESRYVMITKRCEKTDSVNVKDEPTEVREFSSLADAIRQYPGLTPMRADHYNHYKAGFDEAKKGALLPKFKKSFWRLW